MEDLIRQVEGKSKFSIADSTMMLLVQQAMDKAHEKIKSRNGAFARLNHISKFYELAVMQLDGCLKFVQQEADNYILESNHEEVLVDLREIHDRLNQRLLETELAILEKDKVLLERLENEERLKEVLESKETELNLERTRSEGLEEFINSNILEGTNEARKGTEISELKCSVDQQVMNLRQKLEPKRKLLAEGEEVNSRWVDNKRVVKMGVDIDVLKGTMDLAFSKMRNAIFLSDLGPIEQMWRWMVEKDTITILIKGFMENARNNFEEEKKKVRRDVTIMLRDHIFGLEDQILLLRGDIERFATQNHEVIENSSLDVCPKQRIDDIIARLDHLIDLNSKLNESFWDDRVKMAERTYSKKRVSESDANDCKKVIVESLDDVRLKMSKRFVSDKVGKLQEEKEDTALLAIILEDIYLTLFKDLVSRFHMDLLACITWSQIKEELHNNIIDEITNEGYEEIESEKIESGLREEICRLVLIETTKWFRDFVGATSVNCLDCIENNLMKNVNFAVFKEMLCEWNKYEETCHEQDSFRQEIDWILIQEVLRQVVDTVTYHTSELPKKLIANNGENEKETSRACSLLAHCQSISQALKDFEFKILEKLKKTTSQLDNLEMKLESIIRSIASIKEKETVYRNAFVLRCENLRKAETEVDLLGDQVDALVRLFQKMLWTLNQHSQSLHHNPDVRRMSSRFSCLLPQVITQVYC